MILVLSRQGMEVHGDLGHRVVAAGLLPRPDELEIVDVDHLEPGRQGVGLDLPDRHPLGLDEVEVPALDVPGLLGQDGVVVLGKLPALDVLAADSGHGAEEPVEEGLPVGLQGEEAHPHGLGLVIGQGEGQGGLAIRGTTAQHHKAAPVGVEALVQEAPGPSSGSPAFGPSGHKSPGGNPSC